MAAYDQTVLDVRRSGAPSVGGVAQQAAHAAGSASSHARLDGLRDALNQSPRVTQLAALAATLQRTPRTFPPASREGWALAPQPARSAVQRAEAPAAQPNLTGLPDGLKAGVEARSGLAMDDVRVHRNSSKPAQLQALAYAQGTDIHLAPGQERHLPHEAWHVVQQKQGRVQPTMQMKTGVPINDDHGLEHEADVMGALAARGSHATMQMVAEPTSVPARTSVPGVVQAYRQDTSEDGDATLHSQSLRPNLDETGAQPKFSYATRSSPSSGADFLVADDSSIAVHDTTEEPKEFFATDGVFADANARLQEADSPIYLKQAGGSATFRLPGGGSTTLSSIKPDRFEGGDDQQFANLFGDMCIFVANKIMGNDGRKPGEAILRSGSIEASASIAPVRNVGSAIENLADYLSSEQQQPEDSEGVIREALSAMEQQGGDENRDRLPGEAYGRAVHSGRANARAARIGVNKFARPSVGEGFATFSIDSDPGVAQKDYTSGQAVDRLSRWEYHYAAVVAKSKDGRDSITLENYNRTDDAVAIGYDYLLKKFKNEAEDAAERLRSQGKTPKEIDEGVALYLKKEEPVSRKEWTRLVEQRDARSWFFRIHGSGLRQSFHEQQSATSDFVNPLTLRVRRDYGRVMSLQKGLWKVKTPLSQANISFGATRSILDEVERKIDEIFQRMEASFHRSDAGGQPEAERLYKEWLEGVFVPSMARALHAAKRFPKKTLPATTLAELREQARMPEAEASWFEKQKESATSALSSKAKNDAAARAPSVAALCAAIANVPENPFAILPKPHRQDTDDRRDANDDFERLKQERWDKFSHQIGSLPRAERPPRTQIETDAIGEMMRSEAEPTAAAPTSSTSPSLARPPISAGEFDLKTNPGGGDCLFHALEGRTLDGSALLALRREVADERTRMPDNQGHNANAIVATLLQTPERADQAQELTSNLDYVPNDVYAAMQAVPGMYAGDDELVQYCRLRHVRVALVLPTGELRMVDAAGIHNRSYAPVAQGEELRRLLAETNIALYKTPNHYERILGARDPSLEEALARSPNAPQPSRLRASTAIARGETADLSQLLALASRRDQNEGAPVPLRRISESGMSMSMAFDLLGLRLGEFNRTNIERAYRLKALATHPDRGGDRGDIFVLVKEARDLLLDLEQDPDAKAEVERLALTD